MSENPLSPSKLNSMLLSVVIGLMSYGLWQIQEMRTAFSSQLAGMAVQIQNLERIAFRERPAREE